MSQRSYYRWRKITAQQVAVAIFSVIKGNCLMLQEDHRDEQSVWGRISRVLQTETNKNRIIKNELVDRFWIKSCYFNNKSSLQELHKQLCEQQNVKYTPPLHPDNFFEAEAPRYCICQHGETSIPTHEMICCSLCDEWYHGICINVEVQKIKESDNWFCPRCVKNKSIDVPEIFAQDYRRRKRPREDEKNLLRTGLRQGEVEVQGPILDSNIEDEDNHFNVQAVNAENKSLSDILSEVGIILPQDEEPTSSRTPHTQHISVPTRPFSTPKTDQHDILLVSPLGIERISVQTPQSVITKSTVDFNQQRVRRNLFGTPVRTNSQRTPQRTTNTSNNNQSFNTIFHTFENVHTDQYSSSSSDRGNEFLSNRISISPKSFLRSPRRSGGSSAIKEPRFTSTPKTNKRVETTKQPSHTSVFKYPPITRSDTSSDSECGNQNSQTGDRKKDYMKFGKTNADPLSKRNLSSIPATNMRKNDSDNSDKESNDEEKDADNDYPGYAIEGPIEINENFSIRIPSNEWRTIKPNHAGTSKHRSRKFRLVNRGLNKWTDVFAKHFYDQCPDIIKGCTLAFQTHYVNNQTKCITATAVCSRRTQTRGHPSCDVTYRFLMKTRPRKTEDAVLFVTGTGTLCHDLGIPHQRFLTGIYKKTAIKKLKKDKPSVVLRKNYGKKTKNIGILEKGNLTEVRNLKSLQNAKAKQLLLLDRDADVVVDLAKRRAEMKDFPHLTGNKQCSGFIQRIQIHPFVVSMYTLLQIQLLKRLMDLNPNTTLFFDATGGIVKKLPSLYKGKRMLYYSLVATLSQRAAPVTPLLEFISNAHSGFDIGVVLQDFFRKYGEVTNNTKPCYGIKRIETDASHAIISSVMLAFQVGPLHSFIRNAWISLVNGTFTPYVHHICKTHARKMITRKVRELYSNEKIESTFQIWIHGYLNAKDMWSFTRRVKDAVLLCGKKYKTTSVNTVLENLHKDSRREGPNPWNLIDIADVPTQDAPLYALSPFSYYAIALCNDRGVPLPRLMRRIVNPLGQHELSASVQRQLDAEESNNARNPYYNKDFLDYLIKHIFPTACLMNHTLMRLNNTPFVPDTNAAAESWMSILKSVEFNHEKPQRVGRFVTKQEEIMRGRLEMFHLALRRLERQYKTKRNTSNLSMVQMQKQTARKSTSGTKSPVTSKTTPQTKSTAEYRVYGTYDDAPNKQKKKDASNVKLVLNTTKNSKRRNTQFSQASLLSAESQEEQWNARHGQTPPAGSSDLDCLNILPDGCKIFVDGTLTTVSNTCNIDNGLMIMYSLYNLHHPSRRYILEKSDSNVRVAKILTKIFSAMDQADWQLTRQLTLLELMEKEMPLSWIRRGDVFTTEERFLKSISNLIVIKEFRECERGRKCRGALRNGFQFVNPMDFIIRLPELIPKLLNNCRIIECDACSLPKPKVKISYGWSDEGPPPFFGFPIAQGFGQVTEDLVLQRLTYNILGINYKLYAYTIHADNHYTTCFIRRGRNWVYNSLRPGRFIPHKISRRNAVVSGLWLVQDI